jgi:tetratricopeptide (TPR) repeat protein
LEAGAEPARRALTDPCRCEGAPDPVLACGSAGAKSPGGPVRTPRPMLYCPVMKLWERILERLAAVLAPASERAQSYKWRQLQEELREAITRKRFGEIDPLLQRAEAFVRSRILPAREFSVRLNYLGELHENVAGNYARAEKLYGEAQEAALQDPEAISERIVALNNLALLLHQQSRARESEQLFRQLLPMVETAFGPEHPETAVCLENLSAALRGQDQIQEAAELRRRAREMRLRIREVGPPG